MHLVICSFACSFKFSIALDNVRGGQGAIMEGKDKLLVLREASKEERGTHPTSTRQDVASDGGRVEALGTQLRGGCPGL